MEVMHAEGCEGMEGGLRKSRTTARPDTPGKTPQILLDCRNINVEKRSTRPLRNTQKRILGARMRGQMGRYGSSIEEGS